MSPSERIASARLVLDILLALRARDITKEQAARLLGELGSGVDA